MIIKGYGAGAGVTAAGVFADIISELQKGIENTYQAVGSDVLVSTLEIYAQVKANKDKVPGLNVVADEMAVFFKKSKVQAKTTQP